MERNQLLELVLGDHQANTLLRNIKPVKDGAPTISLSRIGAILKKHVQQGRCLVLDPVSSTAYTVGNSLVCCMPEFVASELLTNPANARFTASVVFIYDNYEEMHYHSSHVLGLILEGEGYLCTPDKKLSAKAGDLTVIPRGVMHFFNCDEDGRMVVLALEISEQEIDHQKSHK